MKWVLIYIFSICIFTQNSTDVALQIQRKIQKVMRKCSPAYVSIGAGAGVVISRDGYIITNDHVVGDVDSWSIRTGNGKSYTAEVVGRDSPGDLCLLKIKSSQKNIAFLPLADSDKVEQGDMVMAMGNPFLYATDGTPSVSLGVASALHCYQDNYGDAIQTDASLNPGNSGGPLVNMEGKIIGICGRIASRFQNRRSSGVGFAISSNQVKNFLPLLKKGEEIIHGFLDIGVKEYHNQAVLVTESEFLSLRTDDIILKLDELPIYNLDLFYGKLWTYPAYSTVRLTIRRKDKIVEENMTLSQWKKE